MVSTLCDADSDSLSDSTKTTYFRRLNNFFNQSDNDHKDELNCIKISRQGNTSLGQRGFIFFIYSRHQQDRSNQTLKLENIRILLTDYEKLGYWVAENGVSSFLIRSENGDFSISLLPLGFGRKKE